MRQIISKEDVTKLVGKFIIQLTNEQEHTDITKSENPGFWLEKRISFVGRIYGTDGKPEFDLERGQDLIILNGLYYTHGVYSHEQFVDNFNSCYEGKRFYRLLTNKEVEWLTEYLKFKE